MRIAWLARYICGVSVLLALLTSAITYHPDVQYLGVVFPAVFGGVALVAAGVAVGLRRLPPAHRVHKSGPVSTGLVAIAVMVTLVLVLVG